MSNFNYNIMINKSLLENLLKCDICNTLFDTTVHIPMVVKCGHTFCKSCLLNGKNYQPCPLDKIKNMLNFNTSIRNLKLENLIQKTLNIISPVYTHKIYTKPDVKKADQKYLNKLNNFDFKAKSKLQKNISNDDEKNIFNDSKINLSLANETIETIPINDDKSTVTNSFQIEVADLLNTKNLQNDKIDSTNKRYNIRSININFNMRKSNNANLNNNIEKENNNINALTQKNFNYNVIKNMTTENNSDENEDLKKNNINNISNNKNKSNNKIFAISIKNQSITASKNEKSKNKLKNFKTIEDDENEENCFSSRQLIKLSRKFGIFENENENNNKKNYICSEVVKNKENTITKNPISNFRGRKLIKSNSNLPITINNTMNDEYIKKIYRRKRSSTKKSLSEQALYNFFRANFNNNDTSPINKRKNSLLVTQLISNKNPQGINSINCSVNDNSDNELSNNENIKINKSKTSNLTSTKKESKKTSATNSNIKNSSKNYDEKNDCQKIEELNKKININKMQINKFNNSQNNNNIRNKENNKLSPLHKYNSSLHCISNFQNKSHMKNNKSFSNNNINNPTNQKIIALRNNRRAVTNYENNDIKSMISKVKIRVGQKVYDKRGSIENNNINFKKDLFTKLRKDFQLLFKNENIINKTKYEDLFETALESSFISKIISQEKFLDINLFKVDFINDNNLFIGLYDSEKNLPKKGILQNSNGDHYEGEFVNLKKEGEGKLIYKNGWIYEGTFKNDKHDGYGKIIESGGELYEGEWKNGKIEGRGTRTHKNGDKYIGNYINNIRNGNGIYYFANGDCYEGNWENGKANGNGLFKFRNGDIYEGEFKDNLICGKGKLIKKNGDIYQGEFVNGLIQGKGNITKENGDKFLGYFVNGKKNGFGKLVDKNGKVIQIGNWKMDEFINNND